MDCTINCKFKQHGSYLVSALTVESLQTLQQLFNDRCSNPIKNTDSFGRNISHIAASCGRLDVIEWLNEQQLLKNVLPAKDKESGWTCVHRAVYYGRVDCVVFLHKLMHDWKPFDGEGHSPLDLVVLDSPRTNKRKKKKQRLAVVVLPFESGDVGELTLHNGELLEILHSNESGWAVGKLKCNGNKGLFPINFVEEVQEEERRVVATNISPQCDVYVWGNNINFTLGNGDAGNRSTPELNETIWKCKLSITETVLTKFHSVYLAESGRVYTCGHGLGGRLGHNSEETILIPKLISALSFCKCVAIAGANHHTMVLNENDEVFTFGLNDFHQLGHTPPPKYCVLPTLIQHKSIKGKQIIGIAAARFHSVVYTKDELFTFGLNAGQLGHKKNDNYQIVPKVVSPLYQKDSHIVNVVASDGATLCLLQSGELYLLQDYLCRKIAVKMTNVVKLAMSGGILDYKGPDMNRTEALQIALLKDCGVVEMWRSRYTSFKKCFWLGKKFTAKKVIDISLGKHLLLTINDGQTYVGYCRNESPTACASPLHPISNSSSNHKVEVLSGSFSLDEVIERYKRDRKLCEEVHLEKIPLLYRSVKCFCDAKSRTFAVLQHDPRSGMTKYPVLSDSNLSKNFKKLLENSLKDEHVHDMIVKTKSSILAAHEFIVKCRLKESYDSLSIVELEGSSNVVDFSKSTEKDVEHWLECLYEASFDTIPNLEVSEVKHDSPQITSEEDLKFANEMCGMSLLDLESPYDDHATNLTHIQSSNKSKHKKHHKSAYAVYKDDNDGKSLKSPSKIAKKTKPKMKLYTLEDWREYSNLSDITIVSDDEQLFHCHKCVLMARSDYFNNMLTSGWLECSQDSTISIPVPGDVLNVMLDFLYTGHVKQFKDIDNVNFIGEVLVCADQLLIMRLRELCECSLAEKVSLKNAVEIFQFSCTYNAHQLKIFTSEFIALNLAYYLEARLLDDLSNDDLESFSKEYRAMVNGMDSRIIKSSSYHKNVDLSEQETQQALDTDLKRLKSRQRRFSSLRKKTLSDSEIASSPRDDSNCSENSSPPQSENIDETAVIETSVASATSSPDLEKRVEKQHPKKLTMAWNQEVDNSKERSVKNDDVSVEKQVKLRERKKQAMVGHFKHKSQRERKRELSESKSENMSSLAEVKQESTCPWGNSNVIVSAPSSVKSFKELLTEEHNELISPVRKNNLKIAASKNRKEMSKIAWAKKQSDNSKEICYAERTTDHQPDDFASILHTQQEEKQQHTRDLKKPLTVIQLEERAIQELKEFYQGTALHDEYITVTRAKKVQAVIPFWDRVIS